MCFCMAGCQRPWQTKKSIIFLFLKTATTKIAYVVAFCRAISYVLEYIAQHVRISESQAEINSNFVFNSDNKNSIFLRLFSFCFRVHCPTWPDVRGFGSTQVLANAPGNRILPQQVSIGLKPNR